MLSQICLYLNNWFDDRQPRYLGQFEILESQLNIAEKIKEGQYYRIVGSVFNDGVYKRGEEELKPESFEGGVWLMVVPEDVLELAKDIEAWQKKNGGADSANMSPFQSENFAGVYSYSKSSGGGSNGNRGVPTWQTTFADRLRLYKKVKV